MFLFMEMGVGGDGDGNAVLLTPTLAGVEVGGPLVGGPGGSEGVPAGLVGPVGPLPDRHFLFNPLLTSLEMGYRFFYLTALGLVSGVAMVSAQPGPVTTVKNSNLVFPASTLLTNGLPGLSGPPVTLMVATVQSNSAQGGVVLLVIS